MNICLINPPSPFLIDQKVFPTLGILRLATYLESKNISVDILDLAGSHSPTTDIDNSSLIEDCSLVGFTATTPQIQSVVSINNYIKNRYNCKTVLGGPHITMVHGSLKNGHRRLIGHLRDIQKYFNYQIVGDGELAILKILKGTNEIVLDTENDSNITVSDDIYKSLPYPDRSFIDIESYNYKIDGQKSTSLIGQLGCPFNCGFCGGRGSKSYRRPRSRTVESIINEIDYLYKVYHYTGFMFYDDEINLSPSKFELLLTSLIKYQETNNIKFSFRGFSRSTLMSPRQAELMKTAGFSWLLLGFESGSDLILDTMNKNTTVAQNTQAMEIAKNAGLKVKALMSIGHPGESEDTINETKTWLRYMRPEDLDVTIVTPYPGSSYFDESKFDGKRWVYTNKGQLLFSDDTDFLSNTCFYKGINGQYKSYIETEYLNKQDIINKRNELSNYDS